MLQCNASSKCFHKCHFKYKTITFVNTFRFRNVDKSLSLPVFSGCIKVIEVLWRLSVTSGVPFHHWVCVSGDSSILFFCCRCVTQGRVELLEEGGVSCHSVSLTLSRDHRALDGGHPVRLRIVGCSKFIVRVESTTPFILALDLRSLR